MPVPCHLVLNVTQSQREKNMSWSESTKMLSANGAHFAVHASGKGPAVVLLHGFPELAYSWRHQISALAAAGWHAIAPDLRGYGKTGPQGETRQYAMQNLALDVLGLLDELRIERATLVGHDFGGALAWTLARDYPDRILGIVSLNTPYTRRGACDLANTMRQYKGPDNYMVQFQQPGLGEATLGQDLGATFHALMRRPAKGLEEFRKFDSRLQALPMSLFTGEPELMGEPFLNDAEIAVYVEAFRQSGFTGPLNWYRNLHQNWLDTVDTVDCVEVPALMVSADNDWFLPPETTRGMEALIPDLERTLIADCGHWTQQERPAETTAIIIEWLERRIRPLTQA